MIEVRIRHVDLVEYTDLTAADTYVYQKLVAAGVPLKNGMFSRDGTLETGSDLHSDCMVWRWYEDGEPKQRSGITVQ